MLIVNCIPEDGGWSPIQYMVSLAARTLEAQVLVLDHRMPSRITQAMSILNRRDRNNGDESCLMVCTGPGDLLKILRVGEWRSRFKFIAAWIIDSFWTSHISSVVKLAKPFDQLLVTSIEDVALWKSLTGVPTSWLPWGADVLGCGRMTAERAWDITRVGRQPPEWADDLASAKAAASLGIKFRGRPGGQGLTTLENHRFLADAYGDSKYILAFSNSVNPEKYTHPTRQYLTGRWVDSLACGATVAGIRPRSDTAQELLWPGATLEFPSIDRHAGLEILADALGSWHPGIAANHYLMALQKLDWRWRFNMLATLFRISPGALANELALLRKQIRSLDRSGATP
jgi:hypothetical protein